MTKLLKEFGTLEDGQKIYIYELKNSKNMTVQITNWGATIISIIVPDKLGNTADVVLGHDKVEKYINNDGFLGAIVGRHANRIEDAKFELNGIEYQLLKNDGKNNLHSGKTGLQNMLWDASIVDSNSESCLSLKVTMPDMLENFPGNLDVTVKYTLTEDNQLVIDYYAVSDKDTIINLTNHAYFNLAGHDSGDATGHKLMINADKFTVNNNECLPTGEIRDVKGTVMDFTQLKSFEPGLKSGDEQIKNGHGYDHNWVLNSKGDINVLAAELYDPKSGRAMEVYTTKPGVQFYSGNHLNLVGKNNTPYKKWQGVCLETQYFPNAMKHKHFPSPILKANEPYHHVTFYKFVNK
jgi:aldose 1-epimerase